MSPEAPIDQPLAYDLFCGYGGWASELMRAGFRVVGFDVEAKCEKRYPGEFNLRDVRTIKGEELRGARLIVASPPCQRFSTANATNRDPEKGMELVREAVRIIKEAKPTYWALENVRGAMRYISKELGEPKNRGGMMNHSVYIWGDFPPCLIPRVRKGWKFVRPYDSASMKSSFKGGTQPPSKDPWQNSIVHPAVARSIAEACA